MLTLPRRETSTGMRWRSALAPADLALIAMDARISLFRHADQPGDVPRLMFLTRAAIQMANKLMDLDVQEIEVPSQREVSS